METNISSLHTEINNVKEEIKTNTEKTNEKLKIPTELINKKLKITDSKKEDLEASMKFMSEKFEEQKSELTDIRKLNNHLKEENALLNSAIKNVRIELATVKEKENENAQYIRSSFMLKLSNILVLGKNENSVEIVCKVGELAEIDDFHRNQIDVTHRTSKTKISSIIVLFHKKNSKGHVKRVSMEDDNACQIVNGEPDVKSYIYINESLTKWNRELVRKAKERERQRDRQRKRQRQRELKRNNIYIKVIR